MKTLIMGRTGSGKSRLRAVLEEDYGWSFAKSSTRAQAEACDGYVINPDGADALMAGMPDEQFIVVYLRPADSRLAEEMAVRQAKDPGKALEAYRARIAGEARKFDLFEARMPYMPSVLSFVNDYDPETMDRIARIVDGAASGTENPKVMAAFRLCGDDMALTAQDATGLFSRMPEGTEAVPVALPLGDYYAMGFMDDVLFTDFEAPGGYREAVKRCIGEAVEDVFEGGMGEGVHEAGILPPHPVFGTNSVRSFKFWLK